MVRTSSGYDALSWDQRGHLRFWTYTTATSWSASGTSTYPYDGANGAASATATGTVLPGMSWATFLLHGNFSGDGSANAIAFTTGTPGWGAVKAEANGNIGPSGEGVAFGGIGLLNDGYFVDGLLETADCSPHLTVAQCGGNQRVLKFWKWGGQDFVLVRRAGLPS